MLTTENLPSYRKPSEWVVLLTLFSLINNYIAIETCGKLTLNANKKLIHNY